MNKDMNGHPLSEYQVVMLNAVMVVYLSTGSQNG